MAVLTPPREALSIGHPVEPRTRAGRPFLADGSSERRHRRPGRHRAAVPTTPRPPRARTRGGRVIHMVRASAAGVTAARVHVVLAAEPAVSALVLVVASALTWLAS